MSRWHEGLELWERLWALSEACPDAIVRFERQLRRRFLAGTITKERIIYIASHLLRAGAGSNDVSLREAVKMGHRAVRDHLRVVK
jgi:hypothetical protein